MSPSGQDVISTTQSLSTGKIPFQYELMLEVLCGVVNRPCGFGLCDWLRVCSRDRLV
jgi:hypothetical protein